MKDKDQNLIWEAHVKEVGDKYEDHPEESLGMDPTLPASLTSLLSYPEEEGDDLKNVLAAIDRLMLGAYNLGSNGGEGQSDEFMKALVDIPRKGKLPMIHANQRHQLEPFPRQRTILIL